MRALLFIVSFVALVLGAAWWFTKTPREVDSMQRGVLEPEPSEFAPADQLVTQLDDPDAPIHVGGDAQSLSEEARVALVPETQSAAPDPIDQTKPAAPLELVVIDERSQVALPRFMVRLSDSAGRKIEVVTDDRGEARAELLALGAVTALPFDHEKRRSQPERIVLEHSEKLTLPHRLSVESGPTYRLTFAPPTGPEPRAIDVRITLDNEEGNSGSTYFEPVRAYEPYWREGEEAWVRFPALDETLTRGRRIEARSRDGIWSGEVSATVAVGEAVAPVRIELHARGVVTGKVTSSGAPVEGAQVTVRAAAASQDKSGYAPSGRTNAKGEYRIEFVRTMDVRLRVGSLLHEIRTQDATVRAGETLVQDFDLVALPTVGRIAGTIVSETGTYETKVEVTLARTGNERDVPPLRERVRWKLVDGRRIGEFDFGLVPKGKYRVDCGRVDWFEWTPRRIDVEAPKDDVVVRIADRVLVADLAFEAHDSDNGSPLRRAHVMLETFDGERTKWVDSGDVVLWNYPEDKRLRWRLDKAGYPSRIGDLRSFEVTTVVDGRRRRTAEIHVQPGWSEVVRVTYGKDEKPLENAVVTVDGREAGKTDKSGQLRVSSREKPKSLTVALAGWRMDGGPDLRPPAQRNFRRFVDVRMRPTKKK